MDATNKNNAQTERTDPDKQYRRIGISAVAAALPYRSDAKNPAYAPVTSKCRQEHEDDVD